MRRGVSLAVGGLLLLLAGCGSSNGHRSMNLNTQANAPALPVAALATGTATTPVAGAQMLTVELGEYRVTLDKRSVPARPIHRVVNNAGQRGHQLQVYPKDAVAKSGRGMQMGADRRVQSAVGYLALIPVGQTAALDLVLPAGNWEVAGCLQGSENAKAFAHYDSGMKAPFSVGS